jgi:hypothetical protein
MLMEGPCASKTRMGLNRKAKQLSELNGQYFHGNEQSGLWPFCLVTLHSLIMSDSVIGISRNQVKSLGKNGASAARFLTRRWKHFRMDPTHDESGHALFRLRGKLLAVICRPSLCDHIAMLRESFCASERGPFCKEPLYRKGTLTHTSQVRSFEVLHLCSLLCHST